MRINTILICILCFIPFLSFSQEEKDWGIEFKGFVNGQIFYDTRQIVEAREGMVILFPKRPEYDNNGNDINAAPSFNQLAMTTRLRLNIKGPDSFGAKTSGVIEGDFTGQSNSDNNGFRLREAWVKLDWKKQNLLIGQYWHPLYSPEVRPNTIALNTGAPYHAFSRHIQIRYEHLLGNLKVIAFAGSQRDYTNSGPAGRTSTYLRNAVIPNFHLQFQYKFKEHILGTGADFKRLKPRNSVEIDSKTYSLNATLNSYAFFGFAKLNIGIITAKVQAIYGQNLSEHIMLGGYVESPFDPVTKSFSYTNTNLFSSWIDIETKTKKIKGGLFTGYSKNLGYEKEMPDGTFYGNFNDIDYSYRISPRIMFFSGKTMLAAEFEYTIAAYGDADSSGKLVNTESVGNLRVLAGLFYFF